jgi:hypothetical protein
MISIGCEIGATRREHVFAKCQPQGAETAATIRQWRDTDRGARPKDGFQGDISRGSAPLETVHE